MSAASAPPGDTGPNDPGDPTREKSYRYLRTAMVGLLVCLATAVVYQTGKQDWHLLNSVSAYYYTPAQGIFVGALIGLGACMIALQGRTSLEDTMLNLGGAFAAIVAVVPTARSGDYQRLLHLCRVSDAQLLNGQPVDSPDCPTVNALAAATRGNVENNLSALLVVGALAIVVALLFTVKDGELTGRGLAPVAWLGAGTALVLWVAVLVLRIVDLDWLVDNAHYLAAVGLFVCIFVVALLNARRRSIADAGRDPSVPSGSATRTQQSLHSLRTLLLLTPRNRYVRLAQLMLVVGVVTVVLWLTDVITLFWVEIAVAGLFAIFWMTQTVELD